MAISGIGSIDKYSNILSTGKRVNSAADDAAGLAISEKLTSQINGYDKAVSNALDAQNLLKTAEGGLSGISDNLQRMRELALQASNSFYTAQDKGHIQKEIDQIKQGIADSVNNTSFNTKKLLDGSADNLNFTVSPNGEQYNTSLGDMALQSLGIADFDVTGNFDIGDIDKAIDTVSSMRGSIGASYNALDYITSSDLTASLNLQAARSGIVDADMSKYVTEMRKNEVMDYYKLYMQKKAQEDSGNITMQILGASML